MKQLYIYEIATEKGTEISRQLELMDNTNKFNTMLAETNGEDEIWFVTMSRNCANIWRGFLNTYNENYLMYEVCEA